MKTRKIDDVQFAARVTILLGIVAVTVAVFLMIALIVDVVRNLRTAETPDEHTEVVVEEVERPVAAAVADTVEVGGWEEYVEGEGPAPVWYRPEEPMAAEWIAGEITDKNADNSRTDADNSRTIRTDIGCPDWNYDTTLWGWDGHTAEVWEMDLFSRVFYLEFWGTSLPCSEAGCDAILNLWASGNYGRTLFDALSSYDSKYGYTYRVYPHVWETDYDTDGLAWCRAFCEERFYAGPEWNAMYFQLGGYHDPEWVTPAYEIDGVYFSIREE